MDFDHSSDKGPGDRIGTLSVAGLGNKAEDIVDFIEEKKREITGSRRVLVAGRCTKGIC